MESNWSDFQLFTSQGQHGGRPLLYPDLSLPWFPCNAQAITSGEWRTGWMEPILWTTYCKMRRVQFWTTGSVQSISAPPIASWPGMRGMWVGGDEVVAQNRLDCVPRIHGRYGVITIYHLPSRSFYHVSVDEGEWLLSYWEGLHD